MKFLVVVAFFVVLSHHPSPIHANIPTTESIMEAYEAGRFRTFQTNSNQFVVSSDGAYVYAVGDGIYRAADGSLVENFSHMTRFSPDGKYAWVADDGVYRLSDGHKVIEAKLLHEMIYEGEHSIVVSGEVLFSSDSNYAAVTGVGVFRLSDSAQIIRSNARMMAFNRDGSHIATSDGEVVRLIDGEQMFHFVREDEPFLAAFSPDGAYVIADALYRIHDRQRFDIENITIYFTPNMAYVIALSQGIYRLPDGERVSDFSDMPAQLIAPYFSADSQYVVFDCCGVYRIPDGERIFESGNVIFSSDASHVAVSRSGLYHLDDEQLLWRIDETISIWSSFTPDGAYVALDNSVYRVFDGLLMFENKSPAVFSPDNQYVAFHDDGLYELDTRKKRFDISGVVDSFTDDGAFMSVSAFSDGSQSARLYRVADGHQYEGMQLLHAAARLIAHESSIIVVESRE